LTIYFIFENYWLGTVTLVIVWHQQ